MIRQRQNQGEDRRVAVLPLAFARRLTDRGKGESEGEDAHPGTSSPLRIFRSQGDSSNAGNGHEDHMPGKDRVDVVDVGHVDGVHRHGGKAQGLFAHHLGARLGLGL